ncbi:unnamed protein product [Rangifer tarandus platyrhynchus]|uniref:Uncharacterized protein n=2 Tax=Rangifer tarandus platyrhynchus TaxID=3082113 RepID=A0ABN8ZXW9_RANTA|nr:unnamed protein product [Rangifer tarandus platyrhynchus]CAI9710395.1 unnamed protein product [Rangifer tarandus platyrhynchus]
MLEGVRFARRHPRLGRLRPDGAARDRATCGKGRLALRRTCPKLVRLMTAALALPRYETQIKNLLAPHFCEVIRREGKGEAGAVCSRPLDREKPFHAPEARKSAPIAQNPGIFREIRLPQPSEKTSGRKGFSHGSGSHCR